MKLTFENYLGTAVSLAKQSDSSVLTNEIFSQVSLLFGLEEKSYPNFLWKWQRDNRIGKMIYTLPLDIEPIDISLFETIEVAESEIEPIIAQLHDSIDLDKFKVTFKDGTKVYVEHELSIYVLNKLLSLRPEQRSIAQEYCLESYDNLFEFVVGDL